MADADEHSIVMYERNVEGDLLYQFDVVSLIGHACELLDDEVLQPAGARVEIEYDLRRFAFGQFSPAPARDLLGGAVDASTLSPGSVFVRQAIPLRRDDAAMGALRGALEDLRALRAPVRAIVARGRRAAER
ncbi:MAG: hypothetical protein U0271_47760 [Polyangiaceae bacterium]